MNLNQALKTYFILPVSQFVLSSLPYVWILVSNHVDNPHRLQTNLEAFEQLDFRIIVF